MQRSCSYFLRSICLFSSVGLLIRWLLGLVSAWWNLFRVGFLPRLNRQISQVCFHWASKSASLVSKTPRVRSLQSWPKSQYSLKTVHFWQIRVPPRTRLLAGPPCRKSFLSSRSRLTVQCGLLSPAAISFWCRQSLTSTWYQRLRKHHRTPSRNSSWWIWSSLSRPCPKFATWRRFPLLLSCQSCQIQLRSSLRAPLQMHCV